MKKWKTLLAALAALCTLGLFAACGDTAPDTTSDSTPGASVPSDSTPDDSTPDDSTPDDSTPDDSTPDAPKTITVTWKNGDDVLKTDEGVAADATHTYDGETPEKSGDAQYSYVFKGWDDGVTDADGNVTYTAQFDAVVNKYVINFVLEDGTELQSSEVEYGAMPVYEGTPEKAADDTYTYEFTGWDVEIVAVTGAATYTAQFNPVYKEYSVKFLNADGETLSEKTDYHFGDEVVAPDSPSLAATEYFTFAFEGWDSEVVAVAGSVVYTAVYKSELKEGINANKLSAGVGDGVVLGASEIGGGANYTLGQQNDDGDETPSSVHQSYLALDGNYDLNDYVAFDFTGKNMPEIAFFAKNYNDSMYANGTSKQGIVVVTGITTYDGQLGSGVNGDGTQINYGFPYMIQDAASGSFVSGAFANSALGRANLVDGTHYRVIMGFTGSDSAITLNWYLYNLDTKAVVEQSSMTTWNFFTGSNAQVGNMTINDLSGSIVLYGKFGTECAIDKIHGVFEDTTIENIANGLSSEATYTVTFKGADGAELKTLEGVKFGETVSYDGEMPTPEKKEDALFNYSYAWDKSFGKITADTVYTLTLVSAPKSGIKINKVTTNGDAIVLANSEIGGGANYTFGQNNDDGDATPSFVRQSYLGLEGNYGLNNYVVFDFTGKNMPEIAFFAKNYNDSMYAEGTSKQGIVVVTGITTWDGQIGSGVNNNGTQINYGFPYMIQDAANGGFCQGAFANSALGRANLIDGTHYRVIMGFTEHAESAKITLKWCLYNLDTNEVVEESSMSSWGFFSGSNADVGNMTRDQLSGSIVLYGKFGTTCTIDKLHGVESGTYADVVAKHTSAN
ncbi:MAG: hypothetical protein IKA20_06800 [Clostridia bacterium]|nr:hypothetical protein [Clostridia bacterium]